MASRRDAAARFADQLLARVDALPGVRAAGFASDLPLVPGGGRTTIRWDGRPAPRDSSERLRAAVQVTSRGYLDAMGLRLMTGRFLTERDGAASPPVVVVNEALAREVFLGAEPIGQRLRYGAGTWEVVGVIRDVSYVGLDVAETQPELYLSYRQLASTPMLLSSLKLAVRADGDPLALVPFLRDAVAQVDPTTPLDDVMTMEAHLAASVAQPRFYALFVGLLAVVAVVLAAIGLYGTLAYTVSERRRELGVRIALGAGRGDILSLVLGQGAALVAIGV